MTDETIREAEPENVPEAPKKEEGKPVGPATIVEDSPMIEQFPSHDEPNTSQ